MKAHVLSDLHFEHMNRQRRLDFWARLDHALGRDKPDLAILAGDIGNLSLPHEDLFEDSIQSFLNRYGTVIYVPGNHEFFDTSIAAGNRVLSRI